MTIADIQPYVVPIVVGVASAFLTYLAAKKKAETIERELQVKIDKNGADATAKELQLIIQANASFREESIAYRAEVRSELKIYKMELEQANNRLEELEAVICSQARRIEDLQEENGALKARIVELEAKET